MDCRVSRRTGIDRCRYFDISSDAFCLFITSDQTYCRGLRPCVAANCADELSSASTHDSTSDEVTDIFFEAFYLFITSDETYRHGRTRNAMKPLLRAAETIGACCDCHTELGEDKGWALR
jgi:hypothetical protein